MSAILACAALMIAAMAAVLIVRPSREGPASTELPAMADASHTALQTETAEGIGGRPIYRYSVVAGGVYAAEELASAMLQDPLVANHYQGLVADTVRRETIPHDRRAYVSYRRDGRIYWTRNRVLLRQGETILTDGRTQIRARCGNCISDVPMMPVAEREPDPDELDRLVDADSSVAAVPASVLPQWPVTASTGTPSPGVPDPSSLTPPAAPLVAGSPIPDLSGPVSPRGGGVPPGFVDPPLLPPSPGDTAAPPPDVDPREDIAITDQDDPGPPSDEHTDSLPVPPDESDPPATLGGSPSPELPYSGTWPAPFGPPPAFGPTADTGSQPSDYVVDDPTYEGSFPVEPEGPVPVPEPGTLLLVGGGTVAALFRTLRSRLK